ncbi:MAG: T9SS type A sorting domain-containing protein [Prevotella sp.]|nr:T9SS type A sorting domain-containing protein [Prevotella sp.]
MIRSILKIAITGMFIVGAPAVSMASPSIEIIDNDLQPAVNITVEDGVVRVTGASGEMLYVYNVAGVRVKSIKVDGDDKRFDLNLSKGCYILKVGKVVRKISVR